MSASGFWDGGELHLQQECADNNLKASGCDGTIVDIYWILLDCETAQLKRSSEFTRGRAEAPS